jgi:hypothetical protein
MKLRLGWTAVAVSVLQGCSWVSVNGPPPGHEQMRYFDCTTEDYAAGLDVYAASSNLAVGAIGVAVASEEREVLAGHAALIASAVVSAGLHALSATYGYRTTKECREARSAAAARAHDDLTSAIRGARDHAVQSSGDELAIEAEVGQTPAIAMARTKTGEEEVRLSMSVGTSKILIKVVPATDRHVTVGFQINAPMDGSLCQLRIAADGQAVAVQEQYASTSASAAKQSIWGKVSIDQLAVVAAARRVVVRACAEQAELGAREIAAIDGFVLRARESIALQSDATPKPDAAAAAPAPAPAPVPSASP